MPVAPEYEPRSWPKSSDVIVLRIVAAAENGAHDRPSPARLGEGVGEQRLARSRLAEDEYGRVARERRGGLLPHACHARRGDELVERGRVPALDEQTAHLAEVLSVGSPAFVLLEEGAEERRDRHEEFDPALVDGDLRVAEVDVKHSARLGSPATQGRRERGDDAEHREARARGRRRHRVPDDALVLLERAPHNRAAHLFALLGGERPLVSTGVDHLHAAIGLPQEHHSPIGSEQIDHDVEALVDDPLLFERDERPVEELAHVAPHVLVRERFALEGRRSLRHQCLGFTNSTSHCTTTSLDDAYGGN